MDNIRALIVDDSSAMRKIVERSLRQAGLGIAQILEAGNGAEALAAVQANKVDLILCDINMPVMDGLETRRRGERQGSSGSHDYDRGPRRTRRAGSFGRGAGLHSFFVYSERDHREGRR